MRKALVAGVLGAGLLGAAVPAQAQTRVDINFVAVDQTERICITARPEGGRMCVTGVIAQVDNPNCWLASLEARGAITYAMHGRKDVAEDVKSAEGGEGIHELRVDLDYGGVPQGGTVAVEVSAVAACPGEWRKTFRQAVSGTHTGLNPSAEEVRAALKLLPLQVVAYNASQFRMFDEAHWPIHEDGGFGIGRLKDPTARAIWDWKANVDGLMARYADVMEQARNYPEAMREKTGRKLPNFSKRELLAEFYQQWSGGHYWVPHESESRWVRAQNADDGERALALDEQIRSGKQPADW